MIPQLELYDICLIIIYLFIIYLSAILYVQNKIKTDSIYRYFIPALSLKIAGGMVYALYHVYIYKGGDTFVFYNAARDLNNYTSIFEPSTYGVYFNSFDTSLHDFSPSYNYILKSEDVLFITKITSFINVLGLYSYFTSTLIYSSISFLGLWYFFNTFNRLYPSSTKPFFIAAFCIPTMLLWSSGVLKDTVTIGAIGWIVYAVANLFLFNEKKTVSFIYLLIGIYFIFILKPYLVYLLLPSLFIWIQSNLKAKITSHFIRNLITPILIISIVSASFFVLTSLSSSAGKYSLNNWQNTLQGFHSWHEYLTKTSHQSGYSLGEMEYTLLGVLKKFPAAVNVTFFRPYIWEIRNIPTLLGAFEGLFFLFTTLVVLFRAKGQLVSSIIKNKDVFFLLSFAIPFAFIVGLSSYNFGALSRYKIPAELFYLIALVIIYKGGKSNNGLIEKR